MRRERVGNWCVSFPLWDWSLFCHFPGSNELTDSIFEYHSYTDNHQKLVNRSYRNQSVLVKSMRLQTCNIRCETTPNHVCHNCRSDLLTPFTYCVTEPILDQGMPKLWSILWFSSLESSRLNFGTRNLLPSSFSFKERVGMVQGDPQACMLKMMNIGVIPGVVELLYLEVLIFKWGKLKDITEGHNVSESTYKVCNLQLFL